MLPFDLCTRLRNGTRARLRQVVLPFTNQNQAILSLLLKHGFISSVSYGSDIDCSPDAFKQLSPPQQRLWADMKYRQNRPVLGDIQLVSKPSKRIVVSPDELLRLQTGRRAQFIKPMQLGEIALLKTKLGWMDGTDALKRNIGGELVARARSE